MKKLFSGFTIGLGGFALGLYVGREWAFSTVLSYFRHLQ